MTRPKILVAIASSRALPILPREIMVPEGRERITGQRKHQGRNGAVVAVEVEQA
jgi:hypothetical protein